MSSGGGFHSQHPSHHQMLHPNQASQKQKRPDNDHTVVPWYGGFNVVSEGAAIFRTVIPVKGSTCSALKI